ncbi:hypothetical protein SDC9_194400 [bioreactor metagenome]|uniref:Uncharacterized protein n=1 Tax=bioreactor metagenome TaxID=1076179 RepID=A0A645I668_9ZZZZ
MEQPLVCAVGGGECRADSGGAGRLGSYENHSNECPRGFHVLRHVFGGRLRRDRADDHRLYRRHHGPRGHKHHSREPLQLWQLTADPDDGHERRRNGHGYLQPVRVH